MAKRVVLAASDDGNAWQLHAKAHIKVGDLTYIHDLIQIHTLLASPSKVDLRNLRLRLVLQG